MASHGVVRGSGVRDKSEQARKRELEEIANYKRLVDEVNTKIGEKQYTAEVLQLTSQSLTKNPEYYTVWNHRRLILQHLLATTEATLSGDGQPPARDSPSPAALITDELQFLLPLLKGWPKCYWIWNHRLWLLDQAVEQLQPQIAQKMLQAELGLDTEMLRRDNRNFHGWGYRRIITDKLERVTARAQQAEGEDTIEKVSMAEQEYEYTTKMIKTDLSNFSAWHQRSKLIPRLLDERNADDTARRKMLDSELTLINDALIDPFDSSLWFYHQFLMSTLNPSVGRNASIILEVTNQDRLHYYEQELGRIREMVEENDDCKWIYQNLLYYAAEYLTVEAGNKAVTTQEMRDWLKKLRQLDPLRAGRWDDLERSLDL